MSHRTVRSLTLAIATVAVSAFITGCAGVASGSDVHKLEPTEVSSVSLQIASVFPVFSQAPSPVDALPRSLQIDASTIATSAPTSRHVMILAGIDFYLTAAGTDICLQYGKGAGIGNFSGGTICNNMNEVHKHPLVVTDEALGLSAIVIPLGCTFEGGVPSTGRENSIAVYPTLKLSGKYACPALAIKTDISSPS